jgi:hypothetical protein
LFRKHKGETEMRERNEKPEDQILGAVATLAGLPVVIVATVLILTIPVSLYSSWIESTLWGWFVVPLFHLPPVSTWQMLALGTIVTCWRKKDRALKKEYYESSALVDGVVSILVTTLCFGVGWGIHHWILT